MGLDQCAKVDGEVIAKWRKHNRLQGWMKNLWLGKGGEGDFNCVDLDLTMQDINALEVAIKTKTLPQTDGFFFGKDSYEDVDPKSNVPYYYYPADIAFIKKAKAALKAWKKVTYWSWW